MRWLSCVCLGVLGCQEYDLTGAQGPDGAGPDIEVDPDALTFGPARTDEAVVRSFEVLNVGDFTLDVSDLALEVGALAFEVLTPVPFDVAPGGSHTVEVSFVPVGELTYGQILVRSDDPDEPEVPVALEGLGEVPALEITPETHVFGTICDDQVVLSLENVGLADLLVSEIRYEADSVDLTLSHDLLLPVVLEPNASTEVTVVYAPDGASVSAGILEVESNDPRGVRTADQQSEASGDQVEEVFEVEADPAADILFAIDKSGSMTEESWNLGRAFEDFITDIDDVTDDWRIGVVTKDAGCFNQGIITSATPNYEDVFLNAVTGLQIFAEDDLTESLLELVDVALGQTAVGGCNEGFVRGNAILHVIAVSDEPEQSGQPWSHWIGRWQDRMSDPNLVMVSAVVDDDLSGDCGQYGSEYIPAAEGTGGLVLDVCSSAWGSHASLLGEATASSLDTFLLNALPDPDSIVVTVDGVAYANGWYYDPVRNAIVITTDLPDGSQIAVSYTSLGC